MPRDRQSGREAYWLISPTGLEYFGVQNQPRYGKPFGRSDCKVGWNSVLRLIRFNASVA